MGFGALRVLNEDVVQPGRGFPAHTHRDMEIVTVVLEGALEHRDSIGNGSVIRPGDFQRMTAGSGITHSEFNHSKTERLHLLQIWVVPESTNLSPSYEERHVSDSERRNVLRVVASRDGHDDSLVIHQQAEIYSGLLDAQATVPYALRPNRRAWIQVAGGSVGVLGCSLKSGDGAAVVGEEGFEVTALEPAEILIFDLG